jgi:hypothetical protein
MAKNWPSWSKNDQIFNDATVEITTTRSIDYKYTTIINFDENIDDSLATLENIMIMTTLI